MTNSIRPGNFVNILDPGNVGYEQSSRSEQYHGSYVNQPQRPQRRPPGFQDDTTNLEQLGNQQNTHPQNPTRHPFAGQTNLYSEEPSKPVDSTRNADPFENQQKKSQPVENQPLPGHRANISNSSSSERGQVTEGEMNSPGALPIVNSVDKNTTMQPSHDNINSGTRAEIPALNVNTSQLDLGTLPQGSLNGTTGEAQLPEQQSRFAHRTRKREV